jgi:hypothetical protein
MKEIVIAKLKMAHDVLASALELARAMRLGGEPIAKEDEERLESLRDQVAALREKIKGA